MSRQLCPCVVWRGKNGVDAAHGPGSLLHAARPNRNTPESPKAPDGVTESSHLESQCGAGHGLMKVMTVVGFHASHEQIPPRQLLQDVQHAEQAGFDAAMCSDHFAPWGQRQGESGYAWSWLGAALATTALRFGCVCAPGYRYHPAIVAQAAATLSQMFPGRFWVALGSGEWANEHIVGGRWPSKDARDARLLECADVIRRLLAGETVTHRGLVTVEDAKIWSLPDEPPQLIQPAVSAQTAAQGARWADGVATINQPQDRLRAVVDAYRQAGGDGKLVLQVHVSWAPTMAEAWAVARDQWSTNVFPSPTCWDLTPAHFDQVSVNVSDEQLGNAVLVDDDLGRLADRIRAMVDLGFDEVYLHHVGKEQRPWIDQAAEHLLPRLR